MIELRACGLTHPGRARDHNEDCFRVDSDLGAFLVADGMGGHRYGEVASEIAVRAVSQFVAQTAPSGGSLEETVGSFGEGGDRREPMAASRLRAGIELAHSEVLRAIEQNQDLHGMGTTFVGLLMQQDSGVVGHVGDSRAYRFRGGALELVTQDHTWVHEQVTMGNLSQDQARKHPLKNVVTRALGGERRVEVDVQEVDLAPGDLLLLCSDGLTTMLSDEQIAAELRQERSIEATCSKLVEFANELGGLDNITVILVEVLDQRVG